ncbi:peptidoglycan DD-metalloendopeptidase family protein [Ferrovibrio sp.]|uniref:murein hydrolase activator EnvC family protein n=1 Tax=Ferrovibrio sp. TaxID=1917215 RepID=UPI00260EB9CC|nr:peptidoglycan DD-metalloendopeptidase family protein [Ferrovibrio sp.]
MRKFIPSLALLTLLAAGSSLAQNPQAPQQQLQDVQKRLQESRQRERELGQEAAKLAQKQRDLQKKLVTAARKLQTQEDLVSQSEEKLARLITDEQAAGKALEARRGELAETLASLAHLSRQPPEAMVLAPGSALDMVRASQLMAALVPEIEQRAARLKDELTRLGRLRQGVAAEQERLGKAIDQLDRERRDLEFLQAETAAAAQETAEQRDSEREKSTQLAAQAKDLRALVDRLLEQERREAERRAAEARSRGTPKKGGDREPPEAYAALEGSAALPARGRVVGRFGQSDENGVPLRGIRIEARAGGQVIAPADGKVMFAGPFRGYGQLLIIAHGGGYHSLLAGFGRIDRSVGQWVLAGEPVGLMGNSPGEKPVLYLELRRKGETVNPLPWLASGDRKVSG